MFFSPSVLSLSFFLCVFPPFREARGKRRRWRWGREAPSERPHGKTPLPRPHALPLLPSFPSLFSVSRIDASKALPATQERERTYNESVLVSTCVCVYVRACVCPVIVLLVSLLSLPRCRADKGICRRMMPRFVRRAAAVALHAVATIPSFPT